jgi:hypothetical protein
MMIKKAILGGLGGILVGGSALADIITYTETFGFKPNDSVDLVLDQFDGDESSLMSVIYTITFTKTNGYAQADNDSLQSGSIEFLQTVSADLSSSDVRLLTDSFESIGDDMEILSISSSVEIGATTGDSTTSFDNTGGADYAEWSPSAASYTNSWELASAFFDNVVGDESYVLTLSVSQTTEAVGLGGVSTAQSASDVVGEVSVTYLYVSPIPEPAAIGMIGVAGVLALFVRRRFKA